MYTLDDEGGNPLVAGRYALSLQGTIDQDYISLSIASHVGTVVI